MRPDKIASMKEETITGYRGENAMKRGISKTNDERNKARNNLAGCRVHHTQGNQWSPPTNTEYTPAKYNSASRGGPVRHRKRSRVWGYERGSRGLGGLGTVLFSLADLRLVLNESAAGAAGGSDTVGHDITLDSVRFAGPCVLDGRHEP